VSDRLGTRLGLLAAEERTPGSLDAVRYREPSVGAESRTKGNLYLLAQVSGGDHALTRAVAETLAAVERDYYYDLTGGALVTLSKALAAANRRLFHQRGRLGIPRRAGVALVGLAIRGRQAHVARLGATGAVIVRDDRMYEIPPPAAVTEEDPRVVRRQEAITLGEALEIEPFTWQGEVAPGDRLALVSRNLAGVVGPDELRRAIASLRPASAVEHLHHLFSVRGGQASDGILVVELSELAVTEAGHHLAPVRPSEPLAGLPDQSPVPLADSVGRGLQRGGSLLTRARLAAGRGALAILNTVFAFVPRRGPDYPRSIPLTAALEERRRRRLGALGMLAVAGLLAAGASIAGLPAPRPTDAIPRAAVARAALSTVRDLLAQIEERVDGRDLVDRDPARAARLLGEADAAMRTAIGAGVPIDSLSRLSARIERGLDGLYTVTRIAEATTVLDLVSGFEQIDPIDMVLASDGAAWIIERARGRVIRVDPLTGDAPVVYRAGLSISGLTTGEPWMIATAATDVVVLDRDRHAWRFDLVERIPRRLRLPGIDAVSAASHLLAALQHRAPLEIFNLYLLDPQAEQVDKWTAGNAVPVVYPSGPDPFVQGMPDLPVSEARDLLVDANLWLLHAGTVTRVNFGTPVDQADYSLDPPPDADLRPVLDYRLIDGATVGDRELFFVWDAANARIVAFGRADGSFVRQWLAPGDGPLAGLLDEVLALSVPSVPDGPAVAWLLTPERVVRLVLD